MREWKQKLADAQDELHEKQQRVEDRLSATESQIDLNNEKKKMQKSLEGTLAQLLK